MGVLPSTILDFLVMGPRHRELNCPARGTLKNQHHHCRLYARTVRDGEQRTEIQYRNIQNRDTQDQRASATLAVSGRPVQLASPYAHAMRTGNPTV